MPLWIGLPMVLTSENNLAPNCSNAAFGSKDVLAFGWEENCGSKRTNSYMRWRLLSAFMRVKNLILISNFKSNEVNVYHIFNIKLLLRFY
jgi:hypothetical protein